MHQEGQPLLNHCEQVYMIIIVEADYTENTDKNKANVFALKMLWCQDDPRSLYTTCEKSIEFQQSYEQI